MSLPSFVDAPKHVLDLLSQLHKKSLEQEALIKPGSAKFISTSQLDDMKEKQSTSSNINADFDQLMIDKFIALDEDKCHFMYQLAIATGATNIVEAGTSFGVSTIYLALAVAKNKAVSGRAGKVVATEKEPKKAKVAREYWKQCGKVVEAEIDLKVGNLLETLSQDLPQVDFVLLDIWAALALPTLKIIRPKLRPGAVVLTDNTITGAEGYKDLLAYLRAPGGGFHNVTLPYTGGLEMSVYLP